MGETAFWVENNGQHAGYCCCCCPITYCGCSERLTLSLLLLFEKWAEREIGIVQLNIDLLTSHPRKESCNSSQEKDTSVRCKRVYWLEK